MDNSAFYTNERLIYTKSRLFIMGIFGLTFPDIELTNNNTLNTNDKYKNNYLKTTVQQLTFVHMHVILGPVVLKLILSQNLT
jgi:hypothetical protein